MSVAAAAAGVGVGGDDEPMLEEIELDVAVRWEGHIANHRCWGLIAWGSVEGDEPFLMLVERMYQCDEDGLFTEVTENEQQSFSSIQVITKHQPNTRKQPLRRTHSNRPLLTSCCVLLMIPVKLMSIK